MQWIWDKVTCYWEHVWELGKHFGISLGTHWEQKNPKNPIPKLEQMPSDNANLDSQGPCTPKHMATCVVTFEF
jgi:hypothetical protein